MRVLLAIESSCDETSIAVLKDGHPLALTISSQVEFHKPYGGVVPELASRHHLEVIHPLLEKTLEQAQVTLSDLDAVAVTVGPGLSGSLLVGVAVAKMLGALLGIPVLGVNHMEGHLYSVRLEHQVECPFLCLVCSGGHTQLVRVAKEGHHEILGETRDDAAGEAFDKVAKLIGLEYPGGPIIDKLCRDQGDPKAFAFPRPMQKSALEFSFSGLKTAVRRAWIECGEDSSRLPDIAASFQEAVVDVLISKLLRAAKRFELKRLAVVGGVACNSRLRAKLKEATDLGPYQVFFPKPLYCTDNAAMIGKAAWELREHLLKVPSESLDVRVNMEMLGSS
jgi:tRNA N6-adenosine threonylcarbamoyltransferase